MAKIFHDDDILDDHSFDLASLTSAAQTDQLGHTTVAEQVAELAKQSPGRVNIAVFGPWGSGKSSLFALMQSSLKADTDAGNVVMVPFDAWQNAGTDFSVNFLSALSKSDSAKKSADISRQLFQSRRTLSLPFGLSNRSVGTRIAVFVIAIVVIVAIVPLLWTLHQLSWNSDLLTLDGVLSNVKGWLGYGLSGSVLLVLGAVGVELTRISVDESAPSHNSQFRALFDSIVGDKKKYIVFIDELDRCSSEQLMQTLEGLRTFLGHERVVFVAAFDRDSVATTIADLRKTPGSPTSIDAAYYRTAGEYLDKIFQFQLSLPPKSTHTIRKFALELVEHRKGIWGELAEHGVLEPVVSLLSPAHIRSPRRTKVLLNDYAVNARELQVLLGDDWRLRAQEIAVWTVIQTEFPNLATDMAEEPEIPRYLVDRDISPSRSGFAHLVKQYRNAVTSLDEATGAHAYVVRRRQHHDLTRYLERVLSLRVDFPAPDIIWRTKSRACDEWEDQGLYSALVGAADQSPSSTIAALKGASEADLQQAVEFLARLTEQEFAGEAELLGRVVGEIADDNAAVVSTKAELISSIWRRIVDKDVDWNSASSARGFAKALALTETAPFLTNFAKQIRWAIPDASPETMKVLIEEVPSVTWPAFAKSISDVAIRELDRSPVALNAALLREDAEPSAWLDQGTRAAVVEAMTVKDPEPVQPERNNPQSIAAAAEETEKAQAAMDELRAARHENLLRIGEVWDLLSGHGEVRLWILKLLRSVELIVTGAAELHDELLLRTGPTQSTEDNLLLTMAAIDDQPSKSLGRWKLPEGKVSVPTQLGSAVPRLLALCRSGDTAEEAGALVQLASIGAAFGTNGELSQPISDDLDGLETGDDVAPWANYLSALHVLASQFKSKEAETLRLNLLVDLSIAASATTLTGLLDHVAKETPKTRKNWGRALHERLETLTGQKLTSASTVVLKIDEMRQPRETAIGLPMTVVRQLADGPDWTEILPRWIRTGPRFDRVSTVASPAELAALDPGAWENYGLEAGVRSSSDAWLALDNANAPLASLKAVSVSGVDPAVYKRARATLVAGATDAERAIGAQRFLDLPQDTRSSASNAAAAIVDLSRAPSGARSGDFKYVADLALANHRRFTSEERRLVEAALKLYNPPIIANVKRLAGLAMAGLR